MDGLVVLCNGTKISTSYFIYRRIDTIMRPFHDVHEMNAYRAGHVCLPVGMIQFKKCWTDFDEISYRRYAFGACPKVILLSFLQSISTWRTNILVRWDQH
jgi:hypothetical protein